ncbi:MAG TPA: TAXI family TRAP transporter solute-binding subunit [Hyphomicrobiaceae bacterium]|nr:TAXI family TRAP transporter solute-binding subunit [Hyphomicrobiaceae bacterium]
MRLIVMRLLRATMLAVTAMQQRAKRGRVAGAGCAGLLRLGVLGALLAVCADGTAIAQERTAPLAKAATAQPQRKSGAGHPQQSQPAKRKRETLIVAASRPGASYLSMAQDVAAAMAPDAGVRLLPVVADGGLANVRDALLLRGIDLAIVPSNALARAKASNALGSNVQRRIGYLTALYSEEVHVVVGRDIAGIADLRGRKVALVANDGTAELTASDILEHLDIRAEQLPMPPARALEEVRSGAVAAALLVGGKPLAQVAMLPKDGTLRLMSLPSAALAGDGYLPAVLLAEDYPALIPPGGMVETVAVKAVLVTNRSREETVRRVARHTPAVLDAIARLALSQRNRKWRDVNVGAVLPGWTRTAAAESWLSRAIEQRKEMLEGSADKWERRRPRKRARPAAVASTSSSVVTVRRNKKLLDEYELWARESDRQSAGPPTQQSAGPPAQQSAMSELRAE